MVSLKDLSINCENIESKIKKFIKKNVKNANLNGAIVAASGGIDSAVTLHLTTQALGPENVTVITMPERDVTQERDIMDVRLHCEQLNLTCNTVDITPILHVMRKNLGNYNPSDIISSGNIRSRIRMIIAYHFSNVEHKMVMGTSNKTELLTGFFTKYGDGGVDLMPLADLYKYNIKQLAKYLEIPHNIIVKAPSPGLHPGQTDEEELGCDYDTIDLILYLWDKRYTNKEISEELEKPLQIVKSITNRIKANEHKRRTPLILRLSSTKLMHRRH
jgi:NAD+ synthase